MVTCTFYGSYYDPQPWAEQACMAEYSVPAGCPIHFVTAATVMPSDVTVTDGSGSAAASTTTLVDSQVVQLDTIDVYSCNCDHTTESWTFQRFAVAAPSLQAGDYATISWPGFSGPAASVSITAAAACPTVEWPSSYVSAIACDRCPQDPIGSGSGSDPGSGAGPIFPSRNGSGCATGGSSSLGAVLALLALRRRRASSSSSGA